MAVTNIEEMFNGRTARETATELSAVRTFRVDTNSKFDDGPIVLSSSGLPLIGEEHPSSSFIWCQDRSANPFVSDTATYWLVTCTYTSSVQASEYTPNPLDEPPRFSWASEKFQVPAVKDIDGNGVLNSAGDPYDPPAMKDQTRRIVTMTRNVATVPAWLMDYEDAVNSADFVIDGFPVPAEKAKCDKVLIGPSQTRNSLPYREITIEIHLSRDGWKLEPLDEGFRKISVLDPTKRIDIQDPVTNSKVTAPVLLNGSGAVLDNPSISNAVFREHDVLRKLPFAALPLT